jgi:hypothetical protein
MHRTPRCWRNETLPLAAPDLGPALLPCAAPGKALPRCLAQPPDNLDRRGVHGGKVARRIESLKRAAVSPQAIIPGKRLNHLPVGTPAFWSSHVANKPGSDGGIARC